MNKKASGLLDLGRKRRAERWRRYACIGDFHGGAYECEFVSPYTKSAGNVDANVMVLLQDWASEDVLAGPFLPDRVEHGYDPARGTNRRLKQRLSTHLGLELKDIYATNVFPFVKRGAQNAPVPMRDLVRVAREFALPQIEIVSPILAICLGRAAFAAVVRAMGQRPPATIDASIRTPAPISAFRSRRCWQRSRRRASPINASLSARTSAPCQKVFARRSRPGGCGPIK